MPVVSKADTSYRARKGDVCAIELRRSSTYFHGRTERYSTWYVGTVQSASRQGVIKTALVMQPTESGKLFGHYCREYDLNRGYGWRALTISDPIRRKAAASLVGREFPTGDALRAAIITA